MDSQILSNDLIKSWNSHHLISIMNHYSDDVEIIAPMINSNGN